MNNSCLTSKLLNSFRSSSDKERVSLWNNLAKPSIAQLAMKIYHIYLCESFYLSTANVSGIALTTNLELIMNDIYNKIIYLKCNEVPYHSSLFPDNTLGMYLASEFIFKPSSDLPILLISQDNWTKLAMMFKEQNKIAKPDTITDQINTVIANVTSLLKTPFHLNHIPQNLEHAYANFENSNSTELISFWKKIFVASHLECYVKARLFQAVVKHSTRESSIEPQNSLFTNTTNNSSKKDAVVNTSQVTNNSFSSNRILNPLNKSNTSYNDDDVSGFELVAREHMQTLVTNSKFDNNNAQTATNPDTTNLISPNPVSRDSSFNQDSNNPLAVTAQGIKIVTPSSVNSNTNTKKRKAITLFPHTQPIDVKKITKTSPLIECPWDNNYHNYIEEYTNVLKVEYNQYNNKMYPVIPYFLINAIWNHELKLTMADWALFRLNFNEWRKRSAIFLFSLRDKGPDSKFKYDSEFQAEYEYLLTKQEQCVAGGSSEYYLMKATNKLYKYKSDKVKLKSIIDKSKQEPRLTPNSPILQIKSFKDLSLFTLIPRRTDSPLLHPPKSKTKLLVVPKSNKQDSSTNLPGSELVAIEHNNNQNSISDTTTTAERLNLFIQNYTGCFRRQPKKFQIFNNIIIADAQDIQLKRPSTGPETYSHSPEGLVTILLLLSLLEYFEAHSTNNPQELIDKIYYMVVSTPYESFPIKPIHELFPIYLQYAPADKRPSIEAFKKELEKNFNSKYIDTLFYYDDVESIMKWRFKKVLSTLNGEFFVLTYRFSKLILTSNNPYLELSAKLKTTSNIRNLSYVQNYYEELYRRISGGDLGQGFALLTQQHD